MVLRHTVLSLAVVTSLFAIVGCSSKEKKNEPAPAASPAPEPKGEDKTAPKDDSTQVTEEKLDVENADIVSSFVSVNGRITSQYVLALKFKNDDTAVFTSAKLDGKEIATIAGFEKATVELGIVTKEVIEKVRAVEDSRKMAGEEASIALQGLEGGTYLRITGFTKQLHEVPEAAKLQLILKSKFGEKPFNSEM